MLNFMGIGAQKCGTTWLYKSLSLHPKINFPGGKEVHFWNNREQLNLNNYVDIFIDNDFINGDITPAYAFISKEVIQEIYNLYPNLPLIYFIRNPIERAWSSAKMALARAELEFHEVSNQWFIDHFNSQGSLKRGDYETCIKNWRSVFPTSQLKIYRFEDIKERPVELLNDCLKHIGVNSYFTNEEHLSLLIEPVFSSVPIALPEVLYEELLLIYESKIKSLQRHLDIDLGEWLAK